MSFVVKRKVYGRLFVLHELIGLCHAVIELATAIHINLCLDWLLKALVNYDRNYSGRRAYDTGNIAETSPTIAAGATATDEMVSASAATNIALLQAVETLLQRLEQPIEAKIDMYGHGKLYDSMTKANQFMKNK